MAHETAILAGGCFWGMEDLIRAQPGVIDTEVGYTGGSAENPTYESHAGHAEAIKVLFDAEIISFRKLLEFFFMIHDPSTRNRQGNDVGTSYRSAIFTQSDAQMLTAKTLIGEMEASRKWPGPVVTEIMPAPTFYAAENYHQDYLKRNPNGYTCHFVRPNWKL